LFGASNSCSPQGSETTGGILLAIAAAEADAADHFVVHHDRKAADKHREPAATQAGERRILELCKQHGKATFLATLSRLHDLPEAEMQEAIVELPDGVYEGEDYLDDGDVGGKPARIHIKITIKGDEATFDLSGSCDRVSNFCNTTSFIARSAVATCSRMAVPCGR
jgi:N-methylhydantoinase B